MSKRDLGQ